MNILMMTNTYTPLVGGLERSVKTFAEEYRRRGHRVVIVAPTFKRMPKTERGVIRVPAVKEILGTEFSARLPIPGWMEKHLSGFRPDIVHAHHPFLLGDTAFRVAMAKQIPLVYTHHTLFEQYTHYLPMKTDKAARFVTRLATAYSNLCDRVFAPSESVAKLLRQRGVRTPISVVPTGIDHAHFRDGHGDRFRRQLKIPAQAFIVGHLGRLAPEKNLGFLTRAVVEYLHRHAAAVFVVVGRGPSASWIKRLGTLGRVRDRIYFTGVLHKQGLIDAYDAMDVFAFASKSETQGLVLLEAMAAGVPVVALDAPGAREVVHDRRNGRLLKVESVESFAEALQWFVRLTPARRQAVRQAARETAREFSVSRCAERALQAYAAVAAAQRTPRTRNRVQRLINRVHTEWTLLRKTAGVTKLLLSPNRSAKEARRGAIR